jgi:hypothetical protein
MEPDAGRDARIPPPPAQDEYPPGALVAVVDDLDVARLAAGAAGPLSASEPYVIEASDVVALKARRDEHQGPLARLFLALGDLVSDQGALEDRYVGEARLGHQLVVASAHDDDQADRVWEALKARGAHHGTWTSRWTVRELV